LLGLAVLTGDEAAAREALELAERSGYRTLAERARALLSRG
jgi:hypothetical protein